MAEISKANILGLVGLLGAILMIVGVFLSWIDISTVIASFSETESYSGWTVVTDEEFSELAYNYAPIVALVAGVTAILTTILPTVLHMENIGRILGIVSLILAIVTIVLIVVYNGEVGSFDFTFIGVGVKASTGIGAWISLAGGAILAIGGIIDIIGKVKANSE